MKSLLLVRSLILFLGLSTILILNSCEDENNPADNITVAPETLKIAVFSDPHYYDPTMGTSGAAFELYLAHDRKLIAESEAILESTINAIISTDVEYIFIPGDLTRDGSVQSHTKFVEYLAQLENSGKKVFVVPGNHDLNNHHAAKYEGDSAIPVPYLADSEFKTLYADFGYSEAFDTDPNSMSYVVELSSNTWLIAMDPCRYSENTDESTKTGGIFTTQTCEWITHKLDQANENNIRVLGMMHHGLSEHFVGQKTLFNEYVIDDYLTVSETFVIKGLMAMFTGHFHAQDIVEINAGGNTGYDIQTGSLVTAPSPYRIVTFDSDNVMTIETGRVENIEYELGGATFQEYALEYLQNGMPLTVKYMLMLEFGVSEEQATAVEPLLTQAMIAHYYGDENMSTETYQAIQQVLQNTDQMSQLIGNSLLSIWNDPAPADNDVVLTF